MNITSVSGNRLYHNTVKNDDTQYLNNTNFNGYAITQDGNTYKQSNIGKITLPSISLALTALSVITTLTGLSNTNFRNNYLKRTLKRGIRNVFAALGIGTIIDIIINKVRKNRADKRAEEIQQYMLYQQQVQLPDKNPKQSYLNYYDNL